MNSRGQLNLAVGLLVCAVGSIAGESGAQWPTGRVVEHTFHNITVPARNQSSDMRDLLEDYGEVCVYCHTAHGGDTSRPLWNRLIPSGPYRMYDDGTDMIADPQPTGNSLSCLSCHDGTIGLDEVLNLPNSYTGMGPRGTPIEECESCHNGGNPAAGLNFEGVWFDTDLRKHHPISLVYDPSRDPGFRSAIEIEAAGLVLYEGKVQCMTCHDPHSQRFRPFLRLENSGGILCLTCHVSQPSETTAHDW